MTGQKQSAASAKSIIIKPITSASAARIVRKYHYSGKVVNSSQLHFGIFLDGRCEGAMQFGPSMDKRKLQGLVKDTKWTGFIELNRMALSDKLPRNSESRAIAIALRLIKKHYPHIEWVVSFADATQCGDGTIYRAAGFVLTGMRKNTNIIRLPDGQIATAMTYSKGRHILDGGGSKIPEGAERLAGFQLRYIYFMNPDVRARLTVPELPFSRIAEAGAGMYKGQARGKHKVNAPAVPAGEGGSIPTPALHSKRKIKPCPR